MLSIEEIPICDTGTVLSEYLVDCWLLNLDEFVSGCRQSRRGCLRCGACMAFTVLHRMHGAAYFMEVRTLFFLFQTSV